MPIFDRTPFTSITSFAFTLLFTPRTIYGNASRPYSSDWWRWQRRLYIHWMTFLILTISSNIYYYFPASFRYFIGDLHSLMQLHLLIFYILCMDFSHFKIYSLHLWSTRIINSLLSSDYLYIYEWHEVAIFTLRLLPNAIGMIFFAFSCIICTGIK